MLASAACNTSANATIIFALSLLPTLGIIGFGIDYYTGLSNKTRLDAAADAAALAAITTAETYINNNASSQVDPYLTNSALAAGKAQALKAFPVNAGTTLSSVPAVPSVSVTRTAQTLSATVTYTGAMQTAFGNLFHVSTIPLSGTSTTSVTMGSYIDFYLLLDVSASMGLPTSQAGQSQLAAVNPDNLSQYPTGCNFACHYAGYQGYTLARAMNIQLRVDSVGKAVANLVATAQATQTLTNQYRVGVYPFIVHAAQAAAISTNYAATAAVGNTLGTYLDSGLSASPMGAGGTHLENVLTDLYPFIQRIGDGSSPASPKVIIFIVTDGGQDDQTYPFNGAQISTPNLGYCAYAQQLGVTMSLLYIPYLPIANPNPSFAADEDDKMNQMIPTIPNALRSCANPGFFFTANSDADITAAMQAMFAQALRSARITN